MVENPLAMQETWVQFLSWEDSLEKEIATNSNILAWRIPWTEEPGGLQFMGSQRVRRYWITKHNTLSVEMGQRRECCCHSCKWEGFHLTGIMRGSLGINQLSQLCLSVERLRWRVKSCFFNTLYKYTELKEI